MADINFMGADSLPLISANAIKAALSQRPTIEGSAAITPVQNTSNSSSTIEARVDQVRSQPPGYTLTLVSGKQTLQVTSELPLPVGTRLTLQLPAPNQTLNSAATYAAPTLNATSNAALQPTINAGTAPLAPVPLPNSSGLANALDNQPLSTNAASLNGTSLKSPAPTTTLQVVSIQLPNQQSAPISPSLIQQFMAARMPLLQNQAAPTPPILQTVYQKPGSVLTAQPARQNQVNTSALLTLLNQLPSLKLTSAHSPAPSNAPLMPTEFTHSLASTKVQASTMTATPINTEQTAATLSTNEALLNTRTPTTTTNSNSIPNSVAAILHAWQQQLPTTKELSQASVVAQQINKSGVQYEHQVVKILGDMLAERNQTALTSDVNPAQLFKSLWKKAASLTDAIKHNPQPSLPDASTPTGTNIGQLLQAVKAKLEANAATTPTTATAFESTLQSPPSLLNALLGSDHKAVMSRALIAWARALQSANVNQTARSLPMQPQSDMPEAFRLLQSALAQTETEQVQRLTQQDSWQLTIPLFYRDGEHTREVRMHLSKEEKNTGNSSDKSSTRWRLRLHFHLTNLGPLDIDLELQWPGLQATFWSEEQHTLTALNKELQPLRATLTNMGVHVEELQARHGKLPEVSRNTISSRLIDTHS